MQMTRKEALDEFLGYVGELGDSVARNVAERALNRAIETVWQKHTWRDFQSPTPLELTLVVGQRSYPLPNNFGRLGEGRIRNLTRRTWFPDPLTTEEADEKYPERGTSLEQAGTPADTLLAGVVGVQRQPAVAGENCEIVSSSAADTTNLRVSLVGNDGSGNERRQEFTPNGVTPVSVGSWGWFDEFGKGYRAGVEPTTEGTSSAGTITLRKVTDGTVLQQLFPEESAREHRIITFLPKPIAADVIAFPMMRRPPRLIYDSDPIPADWWNAVFEELQIAWRVNTGELGADSVVPRPHLLTLIGNDNANRPRPTVRPFGR